MVGILQICESN